MKKITIYFDNEHTLSVDLDEEEAEKVIEWFEGTKSVYKLVTSIRTYYVAKEHVRHINVSTL